MSIGKQKKSKDIITAVLVCTHARTHTHTHIHTHKHKHTHTHTNTNTLTCIYKHTPKDSQLALVHSFLPIQSVSLSACQSLLDKSSPSSRHRIFLIFCYKGPTCGFRPFSCSKCVSFSQLFKS